MLQLKIFEMTSDFISKTKTVTRIDMWNQNWVLILKILVIASFNTKTP